MIWTLLLSKYLKWAIYVPSFLKKGIKIPGNWFFRAVMVQFNCVLDCTIQPIYLDPPSCANRWANFYYKLCRIANFTRLIAGTQCCRNTAERHFIGCAHSFYRWASGFVEYLTVLIADIAGCDRSLWLWVYRRSAARRISWCVSTGGVTRVLPPVPAPASAIVR